MSQNLVQSITRKLALVLLLISCATITAQSQAPVKPRPVLEFEGNKIFSSAELQTAANKCLDQYPKGQFSEVFEYCIHQLDFFVKSRGNLQASLIAPSADSVEDQSKLVVRVNEGPIYRVGEVKIDGAHLFPPEQVREVIGLKTGDIANGEAISEGLFERLKARYAKFGYIQYTAEIDPTFHAKEGASEGIVDFAVTIDEAHQFTVRSIKIVGVDSARTDSLQHELLIRGGDIFDDELLRESIKRLTNTGLVDAVDADKDVDYKQPDQSTPFMDLIIHVKRASRL